MIPVTHNFKSYFPYFLIDQVVLWWSLVAHSDWRRRTRSQIPKSMATLYYAEHFTDPDSDPYSLFMCRTGIRVWVRTQVRLRQCKWAIKWPYSKVLLYPFKCKETRTSPEPYLAVQWWFSWRRRGVVQARRAGPPAPSPPSCSGCL